MLLEASTTVADARVVYSSRNEEMLHSTCFLFFTVMANCSSSVKLLCDSGAAVNASDFVRIALSV